MSLVRPQSILWTRLTLAGRLAILAGLFCLEKTILSFFIDFDLAQQASGFGAFLRILQHWGFRFAVAFIAAVAILGIVRRENETQINELMPIRFRWLFVHFILICILAPLSFLLFRYASTNLSLGIVAGSWAVFAAGAVVTGFLSMATMARWLVMARSLGPVWWYAGIAAIVGTSAMQLSQSLWWLTAGVTFDLVGLLLNTFLSSLTSDPRTLVLSTPRFAVQVSEVCSGLEGVGLMIGFVGAWLLYFRREYIFPRALLLIPVSMAAMFTLNVVRIAVLMVIGDAGFPEIAAYGFHSQAGWIAFNTVACAVVFFSRRSRWLTRLANTRTDTTPSRNASAIYLMPFLAILAGGMLSHAISGKFETFYFIRLLGCGCALVAYRNEIHAMDLKFSWRGPVTGALLFFLWFGFGKVLLPPSTMPDGLAALSPTARILWISARAVSAVVTVPIAEELAYRGFLMRRLGHADFEVLPYRSVGWPSLFGSAVIFGIGHGPLWLPGIAAGVAYGILARSRGQLGEAISAHATTNALIALLVLSANQWQLW